MDTHLKSINDIFAEIKSKEKTLLRVLVVYKSPISGLEYRVAYFNSMPEANLWRSQMDEKYKSLGFEYHIYLDMIER